MSASLGGGRQHQEAQQTGSSSSQSESGNEGYGYSGGQSQGTSYGGSQGGSYGQSATTSDVWGAQQPALQGLYAQAANLAGGTSAAGQGAAGVADQARGAWMNQLTPGGNPYFERSVQGAIDQATRGFTEGVLPELDARGVAVGQYGGARDSLARGQAAGTFGEGLANQVAGMYSQQYAGDQQRALGALGLSGNVQGLYTQPLQTASGIIGGPTVLSQQQSSSGAQNSAYNQSQNMASNFGENTQQGWGSAISEAINQGNSSGSGWNANTSGGLKD